MTEDGLARKFAEMLRAEGLDYDAAVVLVRRMPDGMIMAATTGDRDVLVNMYKEGLEQLGVYVTLTRVKTQ